MNSTQAAIVQAVRQYYKFLTTLYLEESKVVEPPPGGWPSITPQVLKGLGKCDQIITMLRHLPYICSTTANHHESAQTSAECYFADWNLISQKLSEGFLSIDVVKSLTEPNIINSPYVIGLTCGARSNTTFLLDINLGRMIFYQHRGWVGTGVSHFFEILKNEFMKLNSKTKVLNGYRKDSPNALAAIEKVRGIYREHGWPKIEQFDKRKCLAAIEAATWDIDWKKLLGGAV
ncbi:hypothetical protein BT63DRAFT_426236 [Microthyrium microscopicum]|uniref:Uncharacterized protein n=1 Tax=Microthyrium microscopicum TaxID=703497 RepID=A0A6A6U5Y8_9PEZI|nr:hypothetical protein BT63DRAFT_426236 [Microthyrium microscopicum]